MKWELINLVETGYQSFYAGGALGFDTLAAQTVLLLREQYPHIKLILVLPYLRQSKSWRQEDQEIYESIKARADEVIFTSQEYRRGCMHIRNRYLVDHSDTVISYLSKTSGGTASTVQYAKKLGRRIINLAPPEYPAEQTGRC